MNAHILQLTKIGIIIQLQDNKMTLFHIQNQKSVSCTPFAVMGVSIID